jgi:DNA-binding beta-propeller fold protein YncE
MLAPAHVRTAPQSSGGSGGWDYLEVDLATHRLFITRATHVIVVDPNQGKIIGHIPDTQGVHGIAFADEFNKGFSTNGRASNSTIFDLASLKVLGDAPTDKDPDGLICDPFSKRAFSFNGDANSSTAIDAAFGKVSGNVARALWLWITLLTPFTW